MTEKFCRTSSDTKEAIQKYTRLVYSIALSHTPTAADADDAFQETFLAYHRSHVMWKDEQHRRAWLIRTAVNMSKRICFSIKRHMSAAQTYSDRTEFSFESAEENEIMMAVRGLSEKYRTAVMLFYFEEMSVREIAAALGTGESTVRSRLSRARAALRKALGNREGGSPFDDPETAETVNDH